MDISDRVFVTVFLGIFIEALPFLLVGVVASAAIHLFISPERMQRILPRGAIGGAIAGSLLGLVLPVCECGSVPTARRLMQKGASPALGIAFLLASPVVNPIVIASTAVAFVGVWGWNFVAWRVGLTLLVAVVVALLLPRLAAGQSLLNTGCSSDLPGALAHTDESRGIINRFVDHARDEFFEMSRFLIIGALLAAGLQTMLPASILLAIGKGPVLSLLALMALAVMLSICSTVDAFVALSFVGSFSPAALLAFLVFGPMVDLKSTFMFTTTFRRPIVAAMVGLIFVLVLGLTSALNWI